LSDQDFKDEFSHTILHNQDAFRTFQATKQKQIEDEENKKREEERLI